MEDQPLPNYVPTKGALHPLEEAYLDALASTRLIMNETQLDHSSTALSEAADKLRRAEINMNGKGDPRMHYTWKDWKRGEELLLVQQQLSLMIDMQNRFNESFYIRDFAGRRQEIRVASTFYQLPLESGYTRMLAAYRTFLQTI